MSYRTHTCSQLTSKDLDQEVVLAGWVNSTRDHGGVIFIDLRDRYGLTQIKADPDTTKSNVMDIAKKVKDEYVIQITGKVILRPAGTENKDLPTGDIEIVPDDIKILSHSDLPPFEIANEHKVREETRMEYRYLDLRRETMKNNIIARHKIISEMMRFYTEHDFLYIETPNLIKNTPEGAREYIVPSRHYPGKAYVLPQSPQQIKQILMVSGFDKYFQLARCFRDEDLRGDRQPEFSQLDVEMSFTEQEDVIALHEQMFLELSKSLYPDKKITNTPFPRLSFEQAMNTYGIDKPEIRTQDLQLTDVSDIAASSELKVFGQVVSEGGCVKALVANKVFTRGEIDKMTALLQEKGAKGLAYIIRDEQEGPKSPILKFFDEKLQKQLFERTGAKPGTTTFFQATDWLRATEMLGYLRTILIEKMELTKGLNDELGFVWIYDFPMFEMDEDTGTLAAMHHPFTKPKDEDIPLVKEIGAIIRGGSKLTDADKKKLLAVKADAYDLGLNGYEIAGGSIRITDPDLQRSIFDIFGMDEQQIMERFGHMLRAFKYGVPPHGGIAVGLDRYVMIMQDMPNIREVIPFPKTQKGEDLMLKSPSEIDDQLLKELGLQIKKK